jgi:hypothetical protein
MDWIAPSEQDTDNAALTMRLCWLDLAVHGFEGDIRHGGNFNRNHGNLHDTTRRFLIYHLL